MGVHTDYPNVVSGRISDRDKALMNKYGFTVRDAVEWFIHFKVNPSNILEFQKILLKKEIQDLKLDLIAKEMELKALEGDSL